jgi:predicted nucleic acid-binding protein
VLDTNLFVAAGFNAGSHAARILAAVRRGELRMIWNEATRREITHVLGRIPPLAAESVDDLFRPEDLYTGATTPERFTIIPDPDDRKFAALAQATGAILISRDEHLLQAREQLEITVLTPQEYWSQYHPLPGGAAV